MEDQEENRLLRNQLLQLIPSGVGVYDVGANTVRKEYLNDGYYQMIGAVRDERHQYDGTSTINAVAPEDLPGLLDEVRAAIREKRMLEYSFRVLSGAEGYRWIAIRANHVPVGGGIERFYAAYYDIDELVRTRDRLRASELLFSDFLTYSGVVHFLYDPDRRRYEITVMPEKLNGFPPSMDDFPESFIRYAALSAEDGESYRKMVRDIDAGAAESGCTVRVRFAQTYTWYRVHMRRLLDANGKTTRIIGNAVNIDQYKEAERAFNEEKLRLGSIRGGLLTASCFNISADRCVEVNGAVPSAAPDLSGAFGRETLAAEPELASQKPETLAVLLAAAEQIPDGGERTQFLRACSHAGMLRQYEAGRREYSLEYRRRWGGSLLWVTTRVLMLPDPETSDILAFCYTADINGRRIRQEVTSRLLSGTYLTAAYVDLEDGRTYRIAAGQSTDAAPPERESFDEANRRSIPLYVHPDDRERCLRELTLQNIRACLESAPAFSLAYRERDEDAPEQGPYRRILLSAFYLDCEKRYLVLTRADTTAQYEQEQRSRRVLEEAASRAESANRAKTDFLSRMSHDIRTPLGGIIGMTALARESDDPAAVRAYLDKIDASGHFLLSLVNDILDMTRVESGRIELHPGSYSYEEFRTYLAAVIQPLCDDKGIAFSLEEPETTETVLTDRLRFNQIFFNLLSNAVKFTPRGGHVRLSVHSLRQGQFLESDFVVRDDGIGINPAFQKRMFEPFEQEYTDVSASRSGSGLGLAIVRSMVELMGGTISVESSLGRGSTFTVHLRLPIVPDGGAAPRTPEDSGALRGKRILVAEDNAINGEIVMQLLRSRGASVTLAADGAQALKQYMDSEQYAYDAILMDVRMPVMDGLQAARAIRRLDRPDARTVPIAALTANAFDEDVRACLAAGMNAHIAKPIEPARLCAKLGELFAGEK